MNMPTLERFASMTKFRVTANVVHNGISEHSGTPWSTTEQLPPFEIEAFTETEAEDKALDILGRDRVDRSSVNVAQVYAPGEAC